MSDRNCFGINVFKVREIVAMPKVTEIAGSLPHMLGVVNIRGQIIPVIDLPAIVGCVPHTGLNIMLVTEFARNAQAFAVESVEDYCAPGLESGAASRIRCGQWHGDQYRAFG